MIYAALPGRSADQLKSSKEVVIDDQTIKLDFVSTNTNQVIEQFISKTKNQKEVTVLSSTPFDLGLDFELNQNDPKLNLSFFQGLFKSRIRF